MKKKLHGFWKRYICDLGRKQLEASAPCAVLNLDKEVVLTKTQNICPLKEELEEMKQSSEKMNQKLEALLKTAEEKKVPVMELKAADVETRV